MSSPGHGKTIDSIWGRLPSRPAIASSSWEGAAEVDAVDSNPAQLHLVALKIAASRTLDHQTRFRLFEVGRHPSAASIYRSELRPNLEPGAVAFWDEHIRRFETGIHTAQGVGRAFARLGRLSRILAPSMPQAIENAVSTAEQLAYWRAHVRGRLFGPATHWLFAHTPLLAPLAPNGLELRRMRHRAYSRDLERRIDDVIGRTLIREHPWWRPVLSGRSVTIGHGAAWLDPSRSDALVANVGRVRLVEGDLVATLESLPVGSLDAVSVSNVPDWLAADDRPRLRHALVRAVAPGGRVLARSILDDGDLLSGPGLLADPISGELPAADRTALYGRIELLRRS